MYWSDKFEIVGINALCDGKGLHFEGPVDLPTEQLRGVLYDEGRVQRVTIPALVNRGVTGFCWLAANEKLPGERLGVGRSLAFFVRKRQKGVLARRLG